MYLCGLFVIVITCVLMKKNIYILSNFQLTFNQTKNKYSKRMNNTTMMSYLHVSCSTYHILILQAIKS